MKIIEHMLIFINLSFIFTVPGQCSCKKPMVAACSLKSNGKRTATRSRPKPAKTPPTTITTKTTTSGHRRPPEVPRSVMVVLEAQSSPLKGPPRNLTSGRPPFWGRAVLLRQKRPLGVKPQVCPPDPHRGLLHKPAGPALSNPGVQPPVSAAAPLTSWDRPRPRPLSGASQSSLRHQDRPEVAKVLWRIWSSLPCPGCPAPGGRRMLFPQHQCRAGTPVLLCLSMTSLILGTNQLSGESKTTENLKKKYFYYCLSLKK